MPPNYDNPPPVDEHGSIALKGFIVALVLLLLLGALAIFNPRVGAAEPTRWLIGIVICAVVVLGLTTITIRLAPPKKKKLKIGEPGTYSAIDQLVDDLDEDEAAYLQQQLERRAEKRRD